MLWSYFFLLDIRSIVSTEGTSRKIINFSKTQLNSQNSVNNTKKPISEMHRQQEKWCPKLIKSCSPHHSRQKTKYPTVHINLHKTLCSVVSRMRRTIRLEVNVCLVSDSFCVAVRLVLLRVAHASEYWILVMATDNLTAVLYKVNDLRLVSDSYWIYWIVIINVPEISPLSEALSMCPKLGISKHELLTTLLIITNIAVT